MKPEFQTFQGFASSINQLPGSPLLTYVSCFTTSVTTRLSTSPNFVALVPKPALCPSVLDFLKSLFCSFLDGMYWICCVYWNFLNEGFFSLNFFLWKICKSDNLSPFLYSLLPLCLDMCVYCVYVGLFFFFFLWHWKVSYRYHDPSLLTSSACIFQGRSILL